MNADAPIVLVCSHPASGQAWWAHVQGWLVDPARRVSRQIHFDKATQRFEPSAAQQLATLADRTVTYSHQPQPTVQNALSRTFASHTSVNNLSFTDIRLGRQDCPRTTARSQRPPTGLAPP